MVHTLKNQWIQVDGGRLHFFDERGVVIGELFKDSQNWWIGVARTFNGPTKGTFAEKKRAKKFVEKNVPM